MQIAKLFIVIILFGLSNIFHFGQTKVDQKIFRIAHIKSISSVNDIKKNNLFDQINNWLFGEEALVLIKPTNLLSNGAGSLTVLDQGLFNLVNCDLYNGKFESLDYNYPSLVSICKYENSIMLFTDSKNNMIYSLTKENKVNPLNDSLNLNRPTGIGYVKSRKEIWVSETGKHSIAILDSLGKFNRRIGKRGTKQSEFNYPTSIWVGKDENIFIVDALNFRVQIFDKYGKFISMFGKQGDATGYFGRPKGIATDSFGNIYVVDALFHHVQIFDKNGRYLYNFGGQGTEEGKFWIPNGIYIDESDIIYIADSYNSRVQIFTLIQN